MVNFWDYSGKPNTFNREKINELIYILVSLHEELPAGSYACHKNDLASRAACQPAITTLMALLLRIGARINKYK